jgi:outer membrane protein
MLRRWPVLVAACLVAGAPALAANAPPPIRLSLGEALRRALDANPVIGRARAEMKAAGALKSGAFSLILPRLQATGGLIRNSEEVAFGSGEDSRVVLPENDWNLRLTLQQPIFAGRREQRVYQQAKEGVRQAEQGLRAAQDRILLRVAADYLAVLQGDALLAVESQSLELAGKRLQEARNLQEAGEVTEVDVLRATSAVKGAERRLALAHREREAAAGQLRLDLDLDGEVEVRDPQAVLPPRPSEEDLLVRAAETRADVQQARSSLRVAELEVAKQKGAYLPVVTADAGYVWQKTSFPSDRYGFAALRFSVPIWQSGEIGARVATARERQRQAELSLQEVRRAAREEVRRALLDAATATTTLALSQEQLAAAEAEYRQVFESYRSQEATSLDVQSSETTLADARRAVVYGRLGSVLAELGVWFAVGDLKSVVLQEVQP